MVNSESDTNNLTNAQKRMAEIRAQHSLARQKALAKPQRQPVEVQQLKKKSPYDIFINLFFSRFSGGCVFGSYVRDQILNIPPNHIDVYVREQDLYNDKENTPPHIMSFITMFDMHDQLVNWRKVKDVIYDDDNTDRFYYKILLEIHNTPIEVNLFTYLPDPEFTCDMLQIGTDGGIIVYNIPDSILGNINFTNITLMCMQHIHLGLLVPIRASYCDDSSEAEGNEHTQNNTIMFGNVPSQLSQDNNHPEMSSFQDGYYPVDEEDLYNPDMESFPYERTHHKLANHIVRRKNIHLLNSAIKMISCGWFLMPDLTGKFIDINLHKLVPEQPNLRPVYTVYLQDRYKHNNQIEAEDDICPSCQDSFTEAPAGTSIKLKCGHAFHMECVYKQMMQLGPTASQCAVCRAEEPLLGSCD